MNAFPILLLALAAPHAPLAAVTLRPDAPDSARASGAGASPTAERAGPGPRAPVETWLWVTRGALTSAASIDRMVERARAARVHGLLVQVVGRGDAYFRSDLLPRAEALPAGDFDPLGRVVERAHAAGLAVHAWMNCTLVWSAPHPPRSPGHVVNRHPEWIIRMPDGRPMTRLSALQRRALEVEGAYVSPARPAVRAWIAATAREIAARYAVDGIHLDYIRGPGEFMGLDPDARARFALAEGADPARFAQLPSARRAALDSAWTAFQRAQVTAIVRAVRDSVDAVREGLPLSAAVLADTVSAERRHAQDWLGWVRDGLLDRVFVMCYAPGVQTVLEQMAACARGVGTERVVPGIAVFNADAPAAQAKARGALELGYRRLALYSYDALEGHPGTWDALEAVLGPRPDAVPPPEETGRP